MGGAAEMSKTKIEWTQETWNPVRGCSRVSRGCERCYAERQAARGLPGLKSPTTGEPFARMTPSGPRWTGHVELIESMLDIPLRRKKPTTYFVNSMSDLFHEALPDEAIDRVFAVMALCPQHTFQVLTKRAKRMRDYISTLHDCANDSRQVRVGMRYSWPLPNVWMGVSCENQKTADERIPLLLQTPAAVRFVSAEPLLSAIDFAKWLSYNPVYEVQAERGVCLSSSAERRSGNPTRRNDLEAQKTRLGSVEAAGGEPSLSTPPSGARLRRVLPGAGDAGWGEDLRAGASLGVSALQWADSGRIDSEPRGRQEETQPPEQSSAGDVQRTTDPRHSRSEGGARLQSGRPDELNVQTDDERSREHQNPPVGRRETEVHSGGFRDRIPDGIEDRAGGPALNLIILGGESGPGARPMHPQWARDVRDQCQTAGVPFFFKQWGEWLPIATPRISGVVRETLIIDGSGKTRLCTWNDVMSTVGDLWAVERVGKRAAGRLLDGQEWRQMPEVKQ